MSFVCLSLIASVAIGLAVDDTIHYLVRLETAATRIRGDTDDPDSAIRLATATIHVDAGKDGETILESALNRLESGLADG